MFEAIINYLTPMDGKPTNCLDHLTGPFRASKRCQRRSIPTRTAREFSPPPLPSTHNDHTELSGPQPVHDLMKTSEVKALLQRSLAVINV